jgi:hypothetical protein
MVDRSFPRCPPAPTPFHHCPSRPGIEEGQKVDAGGGGAGVWVVDGDDEEEGSQRMVRRFPPGRGMMLQFLLPGRATTRWGERNREHEELAGGARAMATRTRTSGSVESNKKFRVQELLSTRRAAAASSMRGMRRGRQNLVAFKTLDFEQRRSRCLMVSNPATMWYPY